MKNFLTKNKLLMLALLEDVLFILFIGVFLISTLEILLPGSISTQIPIPFLFPVVGFTLLLYIFWRKSEKISFSTFPLSKLILFFLLLIGGVLMLFMNRDFGIYASAIQIAVFFLLLVLTFRRQR